MEAIGIGIAKLCSWDEQQPTGTSRSIESQAHVANPEGILKCNKWPTSNPLIFFPTHLLLLAHRGMPSPSNLPSDGHPDAETVQVRNAAPEHGVEGGGGHVVRVVPGDLVHVF